MNTNLSNTQAQAVERLKLASNKINAQEGRYSHVYEYESVTKLNAYFGTCSKIEVELSPLDVDGINLLSAFLEGSKFSQEAQGTCDFGSAAA